MGQTASLAMDSQAIDSQTVDSLATDEAQPCLEGTSVMPPRRRLPGPVELHASAPRTAASCETSAVDSRRPHSDGQHSDDQHSDDQHSDGQHSDHPHSDPPHRGDLKSQILPRPAVLPPPASSRPAAASSTESPEPASSPRAASPSVPPAPTCPPRTAAKLASAPTSNDWNRSAALEPLNWARVYREHSDFVWRSLRRMGLSAADAEDALHEVFLVWHRRQDSFDPSRGTVKSWLFGISVNVVRSLTRKKRRASLHPDSQDCFESEVAQRPIVSESSWRATDGKAQLESGDLKQAIARAVAGLPPEHRAVFIMFEVEGVDCTSISEELGVPVGTVYSRLHTARRHLKEALRAYRHPGAPGKEANK